MVKNETSVKMKKMLCKVPQVTVFFWIIKILCTTVGETAADYVNMTLGLGLTLTSVLVGILLVISMYFQFKADRYILAVYWVNVVLISIFGTLVTDNLTDVIGVPLEVSTIVFSVLLGLTFVVWYWFEKDLSIHSVYTKRREAFYWLAILFTFALGTAVGDLLAEGLGLGYLLTGFIVLSVIVAVFLAWYFLGLDAILAFWIAYIMTRPLGASIGDFLSQPKDNGGLGLGATVTSIIFLVAILAIVVYLTVTKKDTVIQQSTRKPPYTIKASPLKQTIAAVGILAVLSGVGYYMRYQTLAVEAQQSATASAPLGDLSTFITIEEDMLSFVNAGDMSGANEKADELESEWDASASTLKMMNKEKWTEIDQSIDDILHEVRSSSPDEAACKTAIETSLSIMESMQ